MAATFAWGEANGAGMTLSTPTNVNWKNIDDSITTAYTAAPITAGNNSYTKYTYGVLSGSWNQILNGLWAHTAGALGTGLTLKGAPTGASQLTYATPATSANASLTVDMTTAIAIGSGTPVYFGPTGPNTAGKTASVVVGGGNPVYTNFLATQLQTTVSAVAGDTTSCTITLQYD